ncbi:putative Ras GTPase-activating protein-binding protein [Helianthus annuus]|nr:putative Ras GTPase-activating protein-binding protein [Helianthus annuus]
MASWHSSFVSASKVGSQFVQQYYDVLQHQPDFTHRFYNGSSTMIRVDGDSTQTASAVSSLPCSRIEIKTVNSVESRFEGIIVAVSGSVKSDCFSGYREFVQTFFLAPDEKKKDYMAMVDVFHFVSQEDLSGVVYAKDPIDIHYIKRDDSESVEDFLFRFTNETSQILGADEKMKISGFVHGVRDDELVEKLHENIPQTVKDMIDRVKGFVRGKKARAIKNVRCNFSASVPMNDPNQYCEFHQDVGHDTDDCVLLKKEIEEAVQTGNLARLVEEIKYRKGDYSFDANQEELDDEHPKRKKIRMEEPITSPDCIDTQRTSGVKGGTDSFESSMEQPQPISSPANQTNDSQEGP